jgi:protein NrfD
MREEIFVSGRMNHMVDPQLNIWHWQIPLYLFVGGLAAGILFFAALSVITKKENEHTSAVKYAPFAAPVLLIIGLLALFIDLNHKLYFWRLYTTIRLESPMSWGAWVLMLVTPLSFIWCALNIKVLFPKWNWKYKFLFSLETFFLKYKMTLAWIMLVSSVILGIYTGILFSAFNARPLWNTSVLGPLFLTSGLSGGAAVIIYLAKNSLERKYFTRVDLLVIGIELFFIIHMFMGFLASTQVQIDAASLFLGGDYTAPFWIFVVFLGMIVPAFLDILELRGFHVPSIIPMLLVLLGGLMLRFLIAYAGQVSHYVY